MNSDTLLLTTGRMERRLLAYVLAMKLAPADATTEAIEDLANRMIRYSERPMEGGGQGRG